MAQQRGEEHGGLLIRGADGSLWFMRDDATEPVRLEDDVAKDLDRFLEEGTQAQFSGLSPEAIEILRKRFANLPMWGAIIWRATRLPR